jgi:hypothetical protein
MKDQLIIQVPEYMFRRPQCLSATPTAENRDFRTVLTKMFWSSTRKPLQHKSIVEDDVPDLPQGF